MPRLRDVAVALLILWAILQAWHVKDIPEDQLHDASARFDQP